MGIDQSLKQNKSDKVKSRLQNTEWSPGVTEKWLQLSPSIWCQRPEGLAVVTNFSLREVQLRQGILDLRVVNWLKCFRFGSVHAFCKVEKQELSKAPPTYLPTTCPTYPHPGTHSWLLVWIWTSSSFPFTKDACFLSYLEPKFLKLA